MAGIALLSIKFFFKHTHIAEHKTRVSRGGIFANENILSALLKRFHVFNVCSALEFIFGSFFYDLCILYLMYACNLVIDVKLIVKDGELVSVVVVRFSIETNRGRGSVLLLLSRTNCLIPQNFIITLPSSLPFNLRLEGFKISTNFCANMWVFIISRFLKFWLARMIN